MISSVRGWHGKKCLFFTQFMFVLVEGKKQKTNNDVASNRRRM